MKLCAIWTGKTRHRDLAAVLDDYRTRVERFLKLEIIELSEPRTSDDKRRVAEEGKRILSRLDPSDYVVVLDDAGTLHTSPDFAKMIERRMTSGQGDITFIIGGPAGVSASLRSRADLLLSLSRLTLSHDMARAVLVEQLYRAMTIIKGLPYAR